MDPKVASSILVSHPKIAQAPLAQLVEHRTFNPLVPGSIPGGRTFFFPEELPGRTASSIGRAGDS